MCLLLLTKLGGCWSRILQPDLGAFVGQLSSSSTVGNVSWIPSSLWTNLRCVWLVPNINARPFVNSYSRLHYVDTKIDKAGNFFQRSSRLLSNLAEKCQSHICTLPAGQVRRRGSPDVWAHLCRKSWHSVNFNLGKILAENHVLFEF